MVCISIKKYNRDSYENYYSLITVILILLPAISVQGFGGGKGYVSGFFWYADLDRNERLDRDEAKVVYNLADEEISERYDKNKNGGLVLNTAHENKLTGNIAICRGGSDWIFQMKTL